MEQNNSRQPGIGHDRNQDCNALRIAENYDETIEVTTSHKVNPLTFRRRVRCLMISGMTWAQAEQYATTHPIQLSLFYDIGRGAFAVDSEAVDKTPLYNPYTGEEIPEGTEPEEVQGVTYTLPNGKTIELLSEMRTANYDFGDFDETIENLVKAYHKATDKETKETLERRIEAQCDAFADFLAVQYEEIQGTSFTDLSSGIRESLLSYNQ